MRLPLPSMTVGLAAGIAGAVILACAAGGYAYSIHHYESLLQTARATALVQGELIRTALEHQMMENDRSLMGAIIAAFGREPRVESVVLVDRYGVKRFSGGPRALDELDIASPTCQACHRYPPDQRGTSRVIATNGGSILRTVVPIRNRPACHRCHDPGHTINGVLILDYDAGEIHAGLARDLWWMIGGSGLIAFVLAGAIGLVVRLVVLRRLQRFETVARQIAAGDLERRVPAEGSDTLAWLGREFNTMADSMTGLIGEVRRQRERLETVINSIDDGIVVLDERRNVLAANEAFLERAGHSREEELGNCCRNSGACRVEDCPTQACLRSGGRHARICERRGADGRTAWEEVHASPILDSAGRLQQVVEVWRDISERRRAEARLAESHRLASLGMLASGFSHELNTPLATVLACVEGILRDARDAAPSVESERIRESAGIARDQVLRCRGTTQHFLRLARGRAVSAAAVDLQAAIDGVVRLIEPTGRAHSVRVEVHLPAEGINVRVDEADLQHALVNLLLNAIQASKSGDSVSITAENGDIVRIRIEDHGCGIAEEHLDHIFEPFYSARQGGTGLGLFLSLNFVRSCGGDIRVTSSVGAGSVFEIQLPSVTAGAEVHPT